MPTDPDFDAENDIKKGNIRIITYGLPFHFPRFDQQLDSLQTHYGFKEENRGCVTNDVLYQKATDYNEKVIAHLSKRNGKNWHDTYRRQVDSLVRTATFPSDSIR